jgi:hypothetical protein
MPTLRSDLVAGGYLYYDAHTDDARLTLTLCRTAAAYGAAVANYAGVTALRKNGDGRVRGARVQADGDEVEVRSRNGAIAIRAHVTDRIEQGHVFTAFHFPEVRTNLLIGQSADVDTSCPEYKVVAVAVYPSAARSDGELTFASSASSSSTTATSSVASAR